LTRKPKIPAPRKFQKPSDASSEHREQFGRNAAVVAESRHRGYKTAEAAFQLGSVLSSMSNVARAHWVLVVGGGLGVVGLLPGANALLVPPL
jgi:hypothetical protein